MNRSFASLFLALLSISVATPAMAIPTIADPSKLQERFEERTAPSSDASESKVDVPQTPTRTAKASGPSFTLRSVKLTGATVYTEEQLAPLFKDSLGQTITLGETQALADKITAKYRADGYILSQAVVPAQDVKSGALAIRVVEGFIHDVRVEGDVKEGSWRSLVQSYATKIKAERPTNIRTLERYLLLMDDLPGATARGTVRPSPNTFGAADLVVTMNHKTWEGSLSADNRGTRFVGPYQYTGTVAGNSLFGLYDRTLVRVITTSPTDELKFIDVTHEEQLGHEGTRLILNGGYSRSEPSFTLASLDIVGKSKFASGKVVHPFVRSRGENLNGRVVLDYRSNDTDSAGSPLTNDRLTVLRVGGGI